jgi:secondary thiamine-phosphate synthase enzyme
MATRWIQKTLALKSRIRGFHLVTDEILRHLPEVKDLSCGMLHIFIRHTSASLTINENADPDVRTDFENHFNLIAPENARHYIHTLEGSDDMPAHLKASILGSSVSIPVMKGTLALGTWQGIYLCEHRNHGGAREIVLTLWGE